MICFGKEAVSKQLDENSTREVLAHGGELMMAKVNFHTASDTDEIPLHSHPHEQVTYVLKGSFTFAIGGEKKIVGMGDSIYFKANIPHGCIPLEDNSILIDVFTPIREDFIE